MKPETAWACPRCDRVLMWKNRPRDADGRLKLHCGCRTGLGGRLGTGKFGALGVRAKSAEYKRLCRAMAAIGFKAARHDAHVKAYLAELKRLRLESRNLCDAHVKAARACARAWWHIKKKHEDHVKVNRVERRRKEREGLTDRYIVRLLTSCSKSSVAGSGIPQELIDLKREHMKLVRLIQRKQEQANE